MPQFRPKIVEVEARQWDGTMKDADAIIRWVGQGDFLAYYVTDDTGGHIVINTLEGPVYASPNDWVVQGAAGEYKPNKPETFAATYQPI